MFVFIWVLNSIPRHRDTSRCTCHVDYITIDKDQPNFLKDGKTTNWERFVSGIRNTVIVMSLEFKIVAK